MKGSCDMGWKKRAADSIRKISKEHKSRLNRSSTQLSPNKPGTNSKYPYMAEACWGGDDDNYHAHVSVDGLKI